MWGGVLGARVGGERSWSLLHTNGWFLTQMAWVFYPEEVPCTQGSVRWEAEHRSISPEKSF